MSNMIDLLLGAGPEITGRPEEVLECSRLSALLGQPFLVKVHALTGRELDALPRGEDFKLHVILEAAEDPDFRDGALRKKFTPEGRKGAITPLELIGKLFNPGEVMALYNAVMELCGFQEDAIKKK